MAFNPKGSRSRPTGASGRVVPIWHAMCQLDSRGNPIPNLTNAYIALANDPEWTGRFRFNEMLQAVVLGDIPVTDIMAIDVQLWVQANGIPRMGKDPVHDAIELIGRQHPFHPIRDWLTGLVWDGRPRLSSWVTDYLGVPDSEYYRQVGCLFLAAMVARVHEPGCKHDYTLVLEGPQKLEKSKFCSALAGGDEYFSESLPPLDADKEVAAHLAGKWVVEWSELTSFGRTDNERIKAFLTRRIERYRPAYGRKEVNEPRQCVFVATTNKKTWGKDETGARRFWPVRCGAIDLAGFIAAREQLFAEAVNFYKAHRRWWPENEIEDEHFAPVQDDAYEGDAWQQAVAGWDQSIPVETINSYGNLAVSGRKPVTAPFYLLDIARGALDIKADRFHVGDQRRLVAVLERLGWERAKRTTRGIPWTPG